MRFSARSFSLRGKTKGAGGLKCVPMSLEGRRAGYAQLHNYLSDLSVENASMVTCECKCMSMKTT